MAAAAPEGSLRVRQEGATRTRVGPSATIGAQGRVMGRGEIVGPTPEKRRLIFAKRRCARTSTFQINEAAWWTGND
jgi:hypothetical protein